jgi:hypothetical protein
MRPMSVSEIVRANRICPRCDPLVALIGIDYSLRLFHDRGNALIIL